MSCAANTYTATSRSGRTHLSSSGVILSNNGRNTSACALIAGRFERGKEVSGIADIERAWRLGCGMAQGGGAHHRLPRFEGSDEGCDASASFSSSLSTSSTVYGPISLRTVVRASMMSKTRCLCGIGGSAKRHTRYSPCRAHERSPAIGWRSRGRRRQQLRRGPRKGEGRLTSSSVATRQFISLALVLPSVRFSILTRSGAMARSQRW